MDHNSNPNSNLLEADAWPDTRSILRSKIQYDIYTNVQKEVI